MRPGWIRWVILLGFASTSTLAQAVTMKADVELGYQSSYRFSDDDFVHDRPYFLLTQTFEQPLDSSGATLFSGKFALRGWVDTTERQASGAKGYDKELAVREGSLTLSRGDFREEIGFQQIAWGESFGFQAADVVNPHDFRDPLNNDLSWIKLPVLAANTQAFFGSLTVQGVVVPFSRSSLYPEPGTPFDPTVLYPGVTTVSAPAPSLFDPSRRPEYGGRISYLFPFGLDFGVIYYRHGNRNLLYQATSSGVGPVSYVPVDTTGITASFSAGPFVFRDDTVVHLNQPFSTAQLAGVIFGGSQVESITGIDYMFKTLQFGIQGQFEGDYAPDYRKTYGWGSVRSSYRFSKDRFQIGLYAFQGIGNPDRWFQPGFTWNASPDTSIDLHADIIRSGPNIGQGMLGGFSNQSALSLWWTFHATRI